MKKSSIATASLQNTAASQRHQLFKELEECIYRLENIKSKSEFPTLISSQKQHYFMFRLTILRNRRDYLKGNGNRSMNEKNLRDHMRIASELANMVESLMPKTMNTHNTPIDPIEELRQKIRRVRSPIEVCLGTIKVLQSTPHLSGEIKAKLASDYAFLTSWQKHLQKLSPNVLPNEAENQIIIKRMNQVSVLASSVKTTLASNVTIPEELRRLS